jgi:hypothetical protein
MYENNIVERILSNDEILITKAQTECLTNLRKWMVTNNFYSLNAEDVAQEAMCRILEGLRKNAIIVRCSFSTFLMGYCKLIVLEEARGNKKRRTSELQYIIDYCKECFGLNLSVEEVQLRQEQLFILLITKLDTKGKELMTLLFEGVPKDQILDRLGFKNAQAMADKKKSCLKRLEFLLKNGKIREGIRDEVFEINR